MKVSNTLALAESDKNVLIRAIRNGKAALFLGAGASATSLARSGEPVMQGWKLAKTLAELGGIEFNDDSLPSVVTAVVPRRVSRHTFENILREQFTRCEPSSELQGLMSFTWARLYTWNLDDTVTNCKAPAQRLKIFNGLVDPVTPSDDLIHLQVIHLHGEAWKPEHGYIFSEAEYNGAIAKGHRWYTQAISDYADNVPIFVGSKLKEPILSLELDRARPSGNEALGVAFLVTPDCFTPIQIAEFEARGICVVQATLLDFVNFIKAEVSESGLSPLDVLANSSKTGEELVELGQITPSDIAIAQHLKIIRSIDGTDYITRIPNDRLSRTARNFLEGGPPSWSIVRENLPVQLHQLGSMVDQLIEACDSNTRLFVVYGQSGSGKSTATMQGILRLSSLRPEIPVYEIDGNLPSLREGINLLSRIHPKQRVIVYFGESFIFGDSFAEDLLLPGADHLLFIGDARSAEWKNHIRRRLQDVNYKSFEFQRFGPEDYAPLADAILKYVPSPRFHKMSSEKRRDEFSKSNSQLLIAMKEVTHSRNFRDVITEEYNSLRNEDIRLCFLLCGMATLARAGISRGMLKESFERVSRRTTVDEAVRELEGIVSEDRNGRLVARHEVYVRHILENVADAESLRTIITSILRSFTKYDVPVLKNVSRQDGALFRFCLNHNVLRELFKIKGKQRIVREIYSEYEVEFQRDGHFWLQYGQYLSSIRDYEAALPILEKSIQAYPENFFAAHALADVQLRVAAAFPEWNSSVTELVRHSVNTLEKLHSDRSDLTDQYAIVTLAERHIEVLVNHNQMDAARDAAKRYFDEIGQIKMPSPKLDTARTELLHFLTSGVLSSRDTRLQRSVKANNQSRRWRGNRK